MSIIDQVTTIGFRKRKNAKVYYTEHSGRYIGEVLESQEYKHPLTHLNLGDDLVVVDIGANIGMFSLYVYDIAKVIYAIEPILNAIEPFCETIRENRLDKIRLFTLAIGPKTGKGYMNIVEPDIAGGSFLNKDGHREVYEMTLNDFCKREGIDHIDLLKIDCEGGEWDIVRTTDFNLLRIDKIVGEYHGGRINAGYFFQLLDRKGYKCKDFDGWHFTAIKQ